MVTRTLPIALLGVLVLLLAAFSASAATIHVSLLDPTGGVAERLGSIDVVLNGVTAEEKPQGGFVFTDVTHGNYEFVVQRDGTMIHSRLLCVDRDEITLTVQLEWDEIIESFQWSDWTQLPLKNASFEEPLVDSTPPGWRHGWHWERATSFEDKPQYTVSDDFAIDGDFSFRLDGSLAGETVIVSEWLPATPGNLYRASASVYAHDARSPHPNIFLSFWDENGTRIHYRSLRSTGKQSEWERVSVSDMAPENAVLVSVLINGNTNYAGVTYWDDVTLEEAYPIMD